LAGRYFTFSGSGTGKLDLDAYLARRYWTKYHKIPIFEHKRKIEPEDNDSDDGRRDEVVFPGGQQMTVPAGARPMDTESILFWSRDSCWKLSTFARKNDCKPT
jgi:hypothetical protein